MRRARLALAGLVLAVGMIAAAALPDGEGAELYRAKCGKCHRPYAPAEVRPPEWERYLPRMQKRAHLTLEEAETIRRYVETNMTPPPRPPAS